jgi:hypothetical protein
MAAHSPTQMSDSYTAMRPRVMSAYSAIRQARKDRLDELAAALWHAYACGDLSDAEAQGLAEAIERRRDQPPWRRAHQETPFGRAPPARRPFVR